MERRKDDKGRVLKEGESQRKDGRYQYRYTDKTGKRCTIYARDIKTLREKENEIQKLLDAGVKTISSKMTVRDIVYEYIKMHKASVKPNTGSQLDNFKTRIERDSFGDCPISDVTVSMAKMWMTSLYNSGLAYGTVNNFKAIMKPAFDMAYDDNLITRNPFDFSLSKIVQNDAVEKRPITDDEYCRLVMFARSDKRFQKMDTADEIILLYETGLRVSELCGLTFSDIDLEHNILKVERQILKSKKAPRYVGSTKTKYGKRIVPISPAAKESILNLTINRPKVKEKIIDGYKDFLLITTSGNPKLGANVQYDIRRLVAAYNAEYPWEPMPRISPHTFRHTFCTRMILSGMNIKTVQYLMGHSTASVTLDVYSHIMSSTDAVKEFEAHFATLKATPTQKAILSGLVPDVVTPSPLHDTIFTPVLQN